MTLPRRSCFARMFSAFIANFSLRRGRTTTQRLAGVALLAMRLPGMRLDAQAAQFNGAVRTLGSGFFGPQGVTVDASGNVFVADTGHNSVKEILAINGSIPLRHPTILALGSGFSAPCGVAVDGSRDVFAADLNNHAVYEIVAVNDVIPNTNPTIRALSSEVKEPYAVAINASGNVYAADKGNNRIVELGLADAPSLSFATPTGAGSLDVTDGPEAVTLENSGNAPLTINLVNFPADFPEAAGLPVVPFNVSPGSTLSISAEFKPRKAELLSETIRATDDTLNQALAQQRITVTGRGLLAQTVLFTPLASVVYGAVPIDLSKLAKASSLLAVSFHVVSGPATLHGTDLLI